MIIIIYSVKTVININYNHTLIIKNTAIYLMKWVTNSLRQILNSFLAFIAELQMVENSLHLEFKRNL